MARAILALTGLFVTLALSLWVLHDENAENLRAAASMQAAIEREKTERMKLKLAPRIAEIHQKTALIVTTGLIAAVALAGLALVIFALLTRNRKKTILHVTESGMAPEYRRITEGQESGFIEIPGRGKNRLIPIAEEKGTRYV